MNLVWFIYVTSYCKRLFFFVDHFMQLLFTKQVSLIYVNLLFNTYFWYTLLSFFFFLRRLYHLCSLSHYYEYSVARHNLYITGPALQLKKKKMIGMLFYIFPNITWEAYIAFSVFSPPKASWSKVLAGYYFNINNKIVKQDLVCVKLNCWL